MVRKALAFSALVALRSTAGVFHGQLVCLAGDLFAVYISSLATFSSEISDNLPPLCFFSAAAGGERNVDRHQMVINAQICRTCAERCTNY